MAVESFWATGGGFVVTVAASSGCPTSTSVANVMDIRRIRSDTATDPRRSPTIPVEAQQQPSAPQPQPPADASSIATARGR
ncbi:MAG TPA: hypothetical protein VHM48_08685, partial [Candidatus Limnocylindrales bacterium]|nr:hypothetical protein [Candidatus Limnocylindrales bacterium]